MASCKPGAEFNEALLDTYSDEVNRSPTLTTTRPESIHILSHHLGPFDCHGATLEQLWPYLGLWATIRIAWQLRSVVSDLRTVTFQKTGGLHSGKVHSEWIQGTNGPVLHASPSLFCNYLNWWLEKARPSNYLPLPQLVLSPPREHVLVHQDLAPRNMILDPRGHVWLVDWGRSGFYPAFMEHLGMEGPERAMPWLAIRSLTAWWGRMRWSLFCLLACGYSHLHSKGRAALAIVRQRSLRYSWRSRCTLCAIDLNDTHVVVVL